MTPRPDFWTATRFWVWLGCMSFGGPAGQIATMQRELVERRRWFSPRRFFHALDYCMVLPGPEAQQLATYLGWLLHGVPGALVAGITFLLPGFVLLVGLSALYLHYGHLPLVTVVLTTLKPTIVAVIVAAGHRIGKRSLRGARAWVLACAAFLAAVVGVPFPLVVGVAALAGWLLKLNSAHHAAPKGQAQPAAIDDDTPIPSAPWAFLPVLPVLGLGLYLTLAAPLQTMARFFTGASLVTFGGAYAVLPYVQTGGVAHGWITGPQMLDGLALGETTPGPLILVVTFVGYLGAGLAGAAVATFYTFLPSFVFVLGGAPLVERSRKVPALGAPLAGVSSAVVGVILALAVSLGRQVFGDVASYTLFLAALVVLLRFDQSVPRVVLVATGLGLLRGLLS